MRKCISYPLERENGRDKSSIKFKNREYSISLLKVVIQSLMGIVMLLCLFQSGNAQLWNPLDVVPKPNSQFTGNESQIQNLEKQENRTGEGVGEKVSRIIGDKDNSTSASAGLYGVGDLAEKSYKKIPNQSSILEQTLNPRPDKPTGTNHKSESGENISSINRQAIANSTRDLMTMQEEKSNTSEQCKANNATEMSKSVSHCGAMSLMQ